MASSPDPETKRGDKFSTAAKEENIYIPAFISKRPFYANDTSADYLGHQRLQKKDEETKWYDRGKRAAPAATKYRKGACENCGAMTHKVKDCLSRPRARGAKWTGRDIQADEGLQDVKLGWDAKRDRWNGFDAKGFRSVVDEHNQMEELRREVQRAARANDPDAAAGGDDALDAGDKYAEQNDMSKHQATSTRQLRIREDTAKYLLNLDLDSAKYDPKRRTLVDAGATADKAAETFAEQGFMRSTGDAVEFDQAQRYAWEQQETFGNTSQHLQANPTSGEYQRKLIREAEERRKAEKSKLLQDKYGVSLEANNSGEGATTAALRAMAVTENETFVEYDELGLVKGAPKKIVKSRYTEDVFPNNHTSVFGSWWTNFKWGYDCCHSFVMNSYCTGEDGKRAWENSEKQRNGIPMIENSSSAAAVGGVEKPEAKTETEEETQGEAEPPAERRRAKKRTAADMMNGVTEKELEEYRRRRTAAEDPMAQHLGKDDLM
ncbi:mRNA splicing protein [Ceratocystis pirilliformis]|uniref:Pre-mRNA-splicing factor SLU7 n=1 Tax=Ceratocystis pirilliformis TaxID=259994 RepID=A0ABR3Z4R6_9PEZI